MKTKMTTKQAKHRLVLDLSKKCSVAFKAQERIDELKGRDVLVKMREEREWKMDLHNAKMYEKQRQMVEENVRSGKIIPWTAAKTRDARAKPATLFDEQKRHSFSQQEIKLIKQR